MKNCLNIRLLTPADTPRLGDVLREAQASYSKYYTPFPFDDACIRSLLEQANEDCYFGIWWADQLAAFFMLRGFDQGFRTPSFGVFVAERFSGKGLLKLALQYAIAWCELSTVQRLMLKVHPDNQRALQVYERFGFVRTGYDESNGNFIYHLELHNR